MKVEPLFSQDEEINIETYLQKCGITDIDEFLVPTGKALDKPENYDNMQEAYEILMKVIGEE